MFYVSKSEKKTILQYHIDINVTVLVPFGTDFNLPFPL